MADKKISALTGATTPLAGTEVLPIVQSSATVKVSVDNLTAGRSISAADVTVSNLTASRAVATDANKKLVSVANTGTGDNVLATSATLVTPALGTPASGVVTNLTGTASININGTVGATTASTGAFTTLSATGVLSNSEILTSSGILAVNGTNASGSFISVQNSGTAQSRLGSWLRLIGSGAATDSVVYADGAKLGLAVAGTVRATVTTTGFDVAGIVTMSAYGAGAATFNASGVISSISDETWKIKDGVPINPDVMLQKLEPGYWFYNKEKAPIFGQDRQLGFYAQNVHEAIGLEAAPVPETYIDKDKKGNETTITKPWGYYDRSVLAITVMSLKNALDTIEKLKQRITALENATI